MDGIVCSYIEKILNLIVCQQPIGCRVSAVDLDVGVTDFLLTRRLATLDFVMHNLGTCQHILSTMVVVVVSEMISFVKYGGILKAES